MIFVNNNNYYARPRALSQARVCRRGTCAWGRAGVLPTKAAAAAAAAAAGEIPSAKYREREKG